MTTLDEYNRMTVSSLAELGIVVRPEDLIVADLLAYDGPNLCMAPIHYRFKNGRYQQNAWACGDYVYCAHCRNMRIGKYKPWIQRAILEYGDVQFIRVKIKDAVKLKRYLKSRDYLFIPQKKLVEQKHSYVILVYRNVKPKHQHWFDDWKDVIPSEENIEKWIVSTPRGRSSPHISGSLGKPVVSKSNPMLAAPQDTGPSWILTCAGIGSDDFKRIIESVPVGEKSTLEAHIDALEKAGIEVTPHMIKDGSKEYRNGSKTTVWLIPLA